MVFEFQYPLGSTHQRLKPFTSRPSTRESQPTPTDAKPTSKEPSVPKPRPRSSLRNQTMPFNKPFQTLRTREKSTLRRRPRETKRTPFLTRSSPNSRTKSPHGQEGSEQPITYKKILNNRHLQLKWDQYYLAIY